MDCYWSITKLELASGIHRDLEAIWTVNIFSTYSAKQSHKSFLLQIWPLLLFLDTLSPLWSLHLIILTNWQIIYSFSNSLTISESSALTDDEIRQEISRFTLFRAKRKRYALFLFLLASMLFLRLAQIGALLFIAILFTEHINTQRQKNKFSSSTGFCTMVPWHHKQMTYPLCYDAPHCKSLFVLMVPSN